MMILLISLEIKIRNPENSFNGFFFFFLGLNLTVNIVLHQLKLYNVLRFVISNYLFIYFG